MISDIRKYFDLYLKSGGYKEHDDYFNIDNIPDTIFDKAYHLSYSIPSSGESNDFTFEDQYSVEVKLFFKGYKKVKNNVDLAYDMAHQLRKNFVSSDNIRLFNESENMDNPILNIYSNSIIAEKLESNDNNIVVTISLTLRRIFTNC